MIITTTNSIPKIQWRDVEILGIVSGSAIHPKYMNKKLTKGEAWELSTERMTEEAEKLEASAVIKVEYITTPSLWGYIEVIAYGTAIRFDKSKMSESGEETDFYFEETESLLNHPNIVEVFPGQNYSDKNILNINYTHEKILKNSAKKTNAKSVLEKIREKTTDVSYEVGRVYANKENIDYIFDEIAEMSVLFGQLALMETTALKDLKTVIGEKINDKLKKENTTLTHAERKKYYETL